MQSEVREHGLYISGEISVQTLNDARYRQFIEQIKLPNIQFVDMSAVSRADSASIALLLAALRARKLQNSGSLSLRQLPETVQSLAQLYEIEEWIHD